MYLECSVYQPPPKRNLKSQNGSTILHYVTFATRKSRRLQHEVKLEGMGARRITNISKGAICPRKQETGKFLALHTYG